MGCAGSKGDINDQHPNIFQVMNVNEEFRPISPGQIEITDTELIFYQRAKKPTTWSLRNLRKYGFDSEIFSFECGRRCATGEGIFAFKCKKAEQLFNLLQHNIQVRNMSEESHENATTLPAAQPNQREVQRRSASAANPPEGYLNPVVGNGRPPLSRPGSVTSNGPTTPPPCAAQQHENNNNKTAACSQRQGGAEHSYLNADAIAMELGQGHQYINLPSAPAPTLDGPQAPSARNVYMNIDTGQGTPAKPPPPPVAVEAARDDDEKNVVETVVLPLLPSECQSHGVADDAHCYANIDASALDAGDAHGAPAGCNGFVGAALAGPAPEPVEVNYVELDLEPSAPGAVASSKARAVVGDSPVKGKPYVTIDFKKTDALSHSINPRLELEEGCRKTRHNSTIGDVRHSSSISD